MTQQDTVKLLRECDAGIEMGVASIDKVLDYVGDEKLRRLLEECKTEHISIGGEVHTMLDRHCDTGKDPNPIAKSMSWIKTNTKLAINDSDKTVADLVTDGCDMGIKSLNRYLNQYSNADEESKNITIRLIKIEEKLVKNIQIYL